MGFGIQVVLAAVGGIVLKAHSHVDVQEVRHILTYAGGGDGLGDDLRHEGLTDLTEGFHSGHIDNALGIAGQTPQIHGIFGLLVTDYVEIGYNILFQQFRSGNIRHEDVVRVHIVIVGSRRESDGSGFAGDGVHCQCRPLCKGGSHTVIRAGGGVGKVLLGDGHIQRPGILDGIDLLGGLVDLQTLNIQHLLLALELQQHTTLRLKGIGGSDAAAVTGLNRGVLHRGNVHGSKVLLHNGLLIFRGEVRVTGQIHNLGIVAQHLVQRTGVGGTPLAAVGGVGQGLVAHHDNGGIGIVGGGLSQSLLQIHHGIQRVAAVHVGGLTVQTDDVDAVDLGVEVHIFIAVEIHIPAVNILYFLAVVVGLLKLVVTGDGQQFRGIRAEYAVPNGAELGKLLVHTGVHHVAQHQNGGNALGLEFLQSHLQGGVRIGGANLQVNIGQDTHFLALILRQSGIQLGGNVIIGIIGQGVDGDDLALHVKLGLVGILGDDGNAGIASPVIVYIHVVGALGGDGQSTAADEYLGIAGIPIHLVTGKGGILFANLLAVQRHGDIDQFHILVNVDKQGGVVLGDGEKLALGGGGDRRHSQSGNTQSQATNQS